MPPLSKLDLERRFRIEPGSAVRMADLDPAWMGTPEMAELGEHELKDRAKNLLATTIDRLADAQELLWADDTRAVLIILQALDAGGKDGTIKHVMSGLNPQGCRVQSFKRPTNEELDHTFLWRCQRVMPRRGEITVFNRSYYEDVLVARVHPEVLEASRIPDGDRGDGFWRARFDDINAMERHLTRNGTVVLKFMLNISKAEQKRRFLARLDRPHKQWKFSAADVRERRFWDDYMRAYEAALSNTSTDWAPWWVIPADHKFIARTLVAMIITNAIESLGLRYPEVSDEEKAAQQEARRELEAE